MELTIIIGFRDWGLERLELSLKSLKNCIKDLEAEIIVSDFGSADTESVQSVCERMDVVHHFTQADHWSRSKAINSAFEISKGRIIAMTDADMLFTPDTFQHIVTAIESNPNSAVAVQCRDLPQELDASGIRENFGNWSFIESKAHLRPRWGMGGLFAVRRELFSLLRGLDERMHTYGGEDLDFAKRAQDAGNRIVWLENSDVRMYHIWHPSSRAVASVSPAGSQAIAENKKLLERDPTIIRNTTGKVYFRDPEHPIVSVVIASRNRGDLIAESIYSALAQTVLDLEVIVVNDGSDDNTPEVVLSIDDPRLRLINIEPSGISKARNTGTQNARGHFIAVLDDDDLMPINRLERSLRAIQKGYQASYGSFVNFTPDTREFGLNVSKLGFGESTISGNGDAPGHSTWLVPRKLMELVPYDETLTSAVDNNVAIRLAALGIKWKHTERVLLMRRLHDRQISEHDGDNQKKAAKSAQFWFESISDRETRKVSKASYKNIKWPNLPEKTDMFSHVGAWLPDELVIRDVFYTGELGSAHCYLNSSGKLQGKVTLYQNGEAKFESGYLSAVTWKDMALMRRNGLQFQVARHYWNDGVRKGVNPVDIRSSLRQAVLEHCHVKWEGHTFRVSEGAAASSTNLLILEILLEVRGLQDEAIFLTETEAPSGLIAPQAAPDKNELPANESLIRFS
ncbi:glycosyltransferase family 2 protein [Corynebacterium cystitidis]|uniref:Glycosyltransferase involved in cell wall bisynthesis n=1 Tax=Corynebacterium cystitidis DSM 20524 TaxID=1121357 RepID=A0A1H9WAP0_9CORY|nr:glycosyltransferase [Corynebacterium cystitidis]WJY82941.1 Hyaluronan synthase [Corynebacterium cystitidis DSM 20524]SES30841.1 Glycosyltransferase involved in cell wall bisynthesis [Corynebacterium cystitidis DSM 20524]SNV68796.1 glycosyl transferase family protein [Corynebacterium cystitidis]